MKTEDLKKQLSSPLNLHLAGVVALALVNIVLGVQVGLAWRKAKGQPEEQLANQRMQIKTLNLENAPLRGLDTKIVQSKSSIDAFYNKRIPANYSSILLALGDLAAKSHVRLSRVQYTQAPAIPTLVEIRMDASVTGEYTSIMQFINGVEREKTFFVIDALTLNGQQGGMVNLRLRLSTYLRPADAAAIAVEGGN